MTLEEKFMFDLEGYIIIKKVLTSEEVAELNAIADRVYTARKELQATTDKNTRNAGKPSSWAPPYQNLIDHHKAIPYLSELLGPKFRIDHDYCIFMMKGAKRGGLHGGEAEREADHWYKYRDGIMRNGLTVLTYFLTDAKAGDGGFACIPGSHKSNFVFNLPEDILRFERPAHYVIQPEVKAGDALIFTEAVIHGTMPWTADHERRALFYKYSPGHSAWAQNYYNPDDYENLTEQQKRIMASPSVGGRPNSLDETA